MARGKFRPNVVTWDQIDEQSSLPNTDPSLNTRLILAEGDSWFTIGGIPTSNLLFSFRFKKMTMIVNCAMPGDTIKRMSEIEGNQIFRTALSPNGYKWDLILLSGGGNDLIDAAGNILLPRAKRDSKSMKNIKDYCDKEKLKQLITNIQEGYRRLVRLRDTEDSPAKNKPILVHTYDYAVPRNSPSRFFSAPLLGPWLYPAVVNAEIPKRDWIQVSKYLIDQLAEGILRLQEERKLTNFHVVDTRKTLKRAKLGTTGDNGDWMNEIHPNSDGYKKLARAIEGKLRPLLE
jgi:lysophospholipase L1-like esterase